MTTQLRPTLGQVAPCLSKPYQTEPSGQFGTRQCQLSRCSTGPSRVSEEEVYRQEEFKTLPSLSPQNTPVMPSRWPVVTGVSSSLLGFFPRASHHPPVRCKCRHVCPGHGPIPLSKQVQRINYKKKINTGIRCHLVSRPANTPKGWSLSPQCTNPTNHLLRFAGIGRQDTAFFCTDPVCGICFTWLPVARRLPPSICDCREIAFYFWGRETQTTMQNLTVFWNAWLSGIAVTQGVRIENLQ